MININKVIVNINNLYENINTIKEFTKKEIIAVIKSNCYGLNNKYLIKYLKNKQINFFAIVNESEYFYIGQPILVMDSCYKYIDDEHVRYTINSYDDLKEHGYAVELSDFFG